MSVGTGSIKRAAKLNTESSKNAQSKEAAEVKSELTSKKTSATKKEVAKKGTKKTEPKCLGSSPVCHITEELPIYLL